MQPSPDGKPTVGGIQQAAAAIRGHWPVSPEIRQLVARRMAELVEKAEKPRQRVAAARFLIAADAANRKALKGGSRQPSSQEKQSEGTGDARDLWPITSEIRQLVVTAMAEIVEDLDEPAIQIAAARVLFSASSLNQKLDAEDSSAAANSAEQSDVQTNEESIKETIIWIPDNGRDPGLRERVNNAPRVKGAICRVMISDPAEDPGTNGPPNGLVSSGNACDNSDMSYRTSKMRENG